MPDTPGREPAPDHASHVEVRSAGPRGARRRRGTLAIAGLALAAGCSTPAPRSEAARIAPRPHLGLRLLASPPTEPAASTRGGYWLGVDLLGPAAAQQASAAELSEGLVMREPAGQPPPGITVGHVSEISEAVQWMARYAFEPRPTLPPYPRAFQRVPAATPGGGLWRRHGATLVAFVVSGASTDLRPRDIDWPVDQSAILPPGSTWLPGALVPQRAPLFAAPAPSIPPAAEAHGMAARRGGLFVLGWVDRCVDAEDGARCLRWGQVVVRDGDRFCPGYLPLFQVALRTAWVSGDAALPRAQLIPSRVAGATAEFVLLARDRDGQLHRVTLTTATASEGWPRSSLRIEGDTAVVTLGDDSPRRLLVDATLDARPSPRPSTPSDPDR